MLSTNETTDMIAMEKWFMENSQQIELELKKLKENNVPGWTNCSIIVGIVLFGFYYLYQYSQTRNNQSLIAAGLAFSLAIGQYSEYCDMAPSTVRKKLSKSHVDHSLFLFGSKNEIKTAKDLILEKNKQIASLNTKTPVVSKIIDDNIARLQAIRKHVIDHKDKTDDEVIKNIDDAWRSSKPDVNGGNPPTDTVHSTVSHRRR